VAALALMSVLVRMGAFDAALRACNEGIALLGTGDDVLGARIDALLIRGRCLGHIASSGGAGAEDYRGAIDIASVLQNAVSSAGLGVRVKHREVAMAFRDLIVLEAEQRPEAALQSCEYANAWNVSGSHWLAVSRIVPGDWQRIPEGEAIRG